MKANRTRTWNAVSICLCLCTGAALPAQTTALATTQPQNVQGAPKHARPVPPNTVDTPVPPSVTLPPPLIISGDAPTRPLSAAEAVRIALRLQPAIQASKEGVNAAHGRTQQVRSASMPSLNVSLGYNSVTSLSGSTNLSTGYQSDINVRQLLFDFDHTRDLVRQSSALERAASQDLTREQNDIALQVKQTFYLYAQNMRVVAVNEANVKNRQTERELTRTRLNIGVGLPSDVVTAETALSISVIDLNLAQNSAEISRINLAALLGIDPRTPIEAADSVEPMPEVSSVNGLVQTAQRQRPEMLEAEATIQADEGALCAARTTNAPTVSGVIGAAGGSTDDPFGNSELTAGIAISFSPYDGGLTRGRVKEAQANLATAQANLKSTRLLVLSDVSQAYVNLKSAEQRVSTAATAVTNATEGVRIAEGRYSTGLGLFLDIINAQDALLSARTNQVQAELSVEQAHAAIQHAVGDAAAN